MTPPNKIAAANAGWRTQFRFAVHILWSRVPELWTLGVMKAALQTFTVILLFTLAGCLVAPVPSFGHKVASGKRIQAEDLSFVQPGETTRDDAVKSLGEPWAHYQDLGVMVYYWETLEGHWIWGIFAIEDSVGGAEEITRLHYLFIQLDERDRVQRYEFIKSPKNVPTKDLAIQWSKKNAQHTKALH